MEPSYGIWCQNTAKSTWQVPVYAWQRVRVCWRPRKLRRPEVVSETLHESKLWKSAIWWSWHAKRSKSLKQNGGLCDRWSLSCKRSGPSHCFVVARVMVCWLRLGLSLDHFDFGVHTCPNYKVLFTETWPDKTNTDRFCLLERLDMWQCDIALVGSCWFCWGHFHSIAKFGGPDRTRSGRYPGANTLDRSVEQVVRVRMC